MRSFSGKKWKNTLAGNGFQERKAANTMNDSAQILEEEEVAVVEVADFPTEEEALISEQEAFLKIISVSQFKSQPPDILKTKKNDLNKPEEVKIPDLTIIVLNIINLLITTKPTKKAEIRTRTTPTTGTMTTSSQEEIETTHSEDAVVAARITETIITKVPPETSSLITTIVAEINIMTGTAEINITKEAIIAHRELISLIESLSNILG